jgi:uncharacterized protein (AIM24 family)
MSASLIHLDRKEALAWVSEQGILYKIIDSYHSSNAKFEILQYHGEKPASPTDHTCRLKQVRVILNNGTIITETGALQLTQGHISSEPHQNHTFFSKFTQSIRNKLNHLRPTYQGRGEIYLEPSSRHYILHKIEDEELIVDQGMFYCCESSVKVSSFRTKKQDEPRYVTQTKLSGRGICVLQSPVPENQILKFELYNERLQIAPNCVILRSRTLESPMKQLKNFFYSFTGKKDRTETFSGTGQIWIVPSFFRNRLA